MRRLPLLLLPLAAALLMTTPRSAGATPAGGLAGVTIALSPDSGPPGTVVEITGTYAGAPAGSAADAAPAHANVCLDGCPRGLRGLGRR